MSTYNLHRLLQGAFLAHTWRFYTYINRNYPVKVSIPSINIDDTVSPAITKMLLYLIFGPLVL